MSSQRCWRPLSRLPCLRATAARSHLGLARLPLPVFRQTHALVQWPLWLLPAILSAKLPKEAAGTCCLSSASSPTCAPTRQWPLCSPLPTRPPAHKWLQPQRLSPVSPSHGQNALPQRAERGWWATLPAALRRPLLSGHYFIQLTIPIWKRPSFLLPPF